MSKLNYRFPLFNGKMLVQEAEPYLRSYIIAFEDVPAYKN